jgi:hypothetical protein
LRWYGTVGTNGLPWDNAQLWVCENGSDGHKCDVDLAVRQLLSDVCRDVCDDIVALTVQLGGQRDGVDISNGGDFLHDGSPWNHGFVG